MEKCDFPKCRNIADMGYMGRDICNDHWEKICESDGKTENKLLKKIGLVRNGGFVICIEDDIDGR